MGVSSKENPPPLQKSPQASSSPYTDTKEKPVPKPGDAEAEVRAPLLLPSDEPDQVNKPNPIDEMFQLSLMNLALQADADERAPRFVSEHTGRGLRVTCNERGNRYSYDIPGKKITEKHHEPAWSDWIVDGRLLIVYIEPLPADEPLDEERLISKMYKDFKQEG
jgi:hypothetical protein